MLEYDFSHFYVYDELCAFLTQAEKEYPHLVKVESLGKSYEGRDILIATLTNTERGPALEKPGYWIDANTHAGEVTGSAVALFTIAHYTSQYGKDERITRLLDDYAIYILPRITVDGSDHYLTTAHSLRSSKRRYPHEQDREGLYPEDLDGDGRILQMRVKSPNGAYKVSEKDPRIMRVREPDDFGGTYYHVLAEGTINNWDGHEIKLAPPRYGLDLNRNYPYDWAPEGEQRGAGDYPFSEPETRAEAEFWATHRNINGFMTYHTYSGVLLRPYSTHPDDHFDTHDLEVYKRIGDKGTEITGYPCVSVFHGFAYDPKAPMHGAMDDYCYDFFGWFGFTEELWDPMGAAGIEVKDWIGWIKSHPEEDDVKMIEWNDQKLGGKGFIDWHEFDHPQLGKVEIGGWDARRYLQNAPPEYLEDLCRGGAEFTLAHALMSPRIELSVTAEKEAPGIYKVGATVANTGFLPTYTSKRAQARKIVKPIEITLNLPEGASLVTGKGEQEIGQLEGRSNKIYGGWFSSQSATDNERYVEWVVNSPEGLDVEIVAKAERAGTARGKATLD